MINPLPTPDRVLQFPSEIMGGVAGEFADLYSASLEVPAHFFFIGFLTCLGSVLANRLTLKSEIEPQPRLYTLLLGESADDRKSTAINKTVEFFREALESFSTCWGIGSAEGLARQLERDPSLLLCLDEFRQLVSKAKIESSVLLPCITTLYESNRYESRTKHSDIRLENAFLSILAASTIDTYQQIMDSHFIAIGFPNRLFLVPGGAEKRFSVPPKIPEGEKEVVRRQLSKILSLVGGHRELDFTPEAQAFFQDWYMSLERSIHSKRLDTYALRFMALLAVNELKTVIDVEEVLKATILMDWQLQVRKLHDPIDADSKIARVEERIRRVLGTGPKGERDLKRAINVSRVGLWIYDQARGNLERAKEITFNGKEQKWDLIK